MRIFSHPAFQVHVADYRLVAHLEKSSVGVGLAAERTEAGYVYLVESSAGVSGCMKRKESSVGSGLAASSTEPGLERAVAVQNCSDTLDSQIVIDEKVGTVA